jgi:predicted patatin/cPLA2 family phospholipase
MTTDPGDHQAVSPTGLYMGAFQFTFRAQDQGRAQILVARSDNGYREIWVMAVPHEAQWAAPASNGVPQFMQ